MSTSTITAHESTRTSVACSPTAVKGLAYDWQSIVAEVEAADLDGEFARFDSAPSHS